MNKYWGYVIIAVLAFVLGSVVVVSAQTIDKLVISSEDGSKTANVNNTGRLLVKTQAQVGVKNFPAVQDVRLTNTEDLQGPPGLACWDLSGNGIPNVVAEDTNKDGKVDVNDCRGADGANRADGADGAPGADGQDFGGADFLASFGNPSIGDDGFSAGGGCVGDKYLGEVWMFAGNFAPRGSAFAHGQLLPISQNEALYSLLGTIYGGDGRTSFGLPDMRGLEPDGVSYFICLGGLFPSRN